MSGFDDTGHPPPLISKKGAYEKWIEEKRRELKKAKKENQGDKAT